MNWAIYIPSDLLVEFTADSQLMNSIPAVQVDSDAFVDENKFCLENIAYSGIPVVAVSSLLPDSVCRNLDGLESTVLKSFSQHVNRRVPLMKSFGCRYVSVSPKTLRNCSEKTVASNEGAFWQDLSLQLLATQIKLCLHYSYPLPPNMCYKSRNDIELSAICGQLDVYLNNLEKKPSITKILSECNFNISVIRINYLRVEGTDLSNEFIINLWDNITEYDSEILVVFRPLHQTYSALSDEWLRICNLLDKKS